MARNTTGMINMEEDYKLPIKVLKAEDLKFIVGSPDPTGKMGIVENIRQLPDSYLVEVWHELKGRDDATHKAHIYMIPAHSVSWIRADGLLVDTSKQVSTGEEE